MPRITVKIDPVGKIEIEGHDFTDSSCKSKLLPLERKLLKDGASTEDKPEASIPAVQNSQQNLHW